MIAAIVILAIAWFVLEPPPTRRAKAAIAVVIGAAAIAFFMTKTAEVASSAMPARPDMDMACPCAQPRGSITAEIDDQIAYEAEE